MAAIANVALTDTFDEWRTKTNQLINVYDETNLLARSSYNATNLAVVTAANIAANIISGNSAVYTTIYDNANSTINTIVTITLTGFYDASNASFNRANASLITSNNAYDRANLAQDGSNTAQSFVISYSSNTNNTINSFFNSMNVEANITRTIANLAYDTANNFVANASNSVAEVLASNTIVQNIINTTATAVIADILGNTDFGGAFNTANLAFDKANTANVLAYNTGIGANAFTSATIAGANTAVGAGANAFTSDTIAGANTIVGTGANAFTSATIAGANTAVGAGANAYANLVWSRSNTFASAVGTSANAFTSATIAGANTAVGAGANAFSTAAISPVNDIAIAAFIKANTASSNTLNAAFDTANSAFDKANLSSGGSYYIGNNGRVGSEANGKNDIFRVNNNFISSNLYFSSGENGSATGPLTVNTGIVVQINTGARVVII